MKDRRLLAVLAHPDDESLGLGGPLALYAADGVQTFVVTATLGQSGRYRGIRSGEAGHPGSAELERIREGELHAAADVLGVRDLVLLGYPDQGLDRVPPGEIVGRLAAQIRRLRPQVVVTFPPDGAYGHPDHVAICQFTTSALVAAADPTFAASGGHAPHRVDKLYYLAWSESSMRAYEDAFGTLRPTVDGTTRHAVFWPEWAITTVLDSRAHWETAWRAIRCHASQVAAYGRLEQLGPVEHEVLWGWTSFYRAHSLVNGGRAREHDLFEGIG